MKNEEASTAAPRRTSLPRIYLWTLTVITIVLASALLRWGTPWSIARAGDATFARGYELAGYWDGVDVPGGKFVRPNGIAVAMDGDVYIADARKRIVRLDASGGFKAEWGRAGKGAGEFSNPVDVAVAPDGSVFVSDYDQDRVQKFTADGRYLLQLGRSGSGPGEFDAPAGLTVDGAGAVYVADFYHHRIHKFSGTGAFQAMVGYPGRLGAGALHYPTGVHARADGRLVVADAYNYQLQWFDASGRPTHRAGHHLLWLWPRPAAAAAGFNAPTGVTVGPDGFIHVADSGNHRVVLLSEKGAYVAEWKIPGADPGVYSPEKIAVSPDGRTVYATDFAGDRIIVLRLAEQVSGRAR